jgi:hypothetical protein
MVKYRKIYWLGQIVGNVSCREGKMFWEGGELREIAPARQQAEQRGAIPLPAGLLCGYWFLFVKKPTEVFHIKRRGVVPCALNSAYLLRGKA